MRDDTVGAELWVGCRGLLGPSVTFANWFATPNALAWIPFQDIFAELRKRISAQINNSCSLGVGHFAPW